MGKSSFIAWLNRNIFVKHLVLVVCAVVILIFVAYVGLNMLTRHNKYHQVPDLAQMTVEQAEDAVRSNGRLKLEINDSLYFSNFPPGVILSQNPEPGAEVKSGRRVFVTINSFRQKMVRIPYVTGVSLRQAKNNLEVAELEIEKLVYQSDMATNYVLETRYGDQVITPGSTLEAEKGSGITLVVGRNEEESMTIIPKVIGFPYKEARSRLWEVGLNVADAVFDDGDTPLARTNSRVYKQSPEQGARVSLGTPVKLFLTSAPEKIEQGSTASDEAAARLGSQRRAEEEAAAAQRAESEGAEVDAGEEGVDEHFD